MSVAKTIYGGGDPPPPPSEEFLMWWSAQYYPHDFMDMAWSIWLASQDAMLRKQVHA